MVDEKDKKICVKCGKNFRRIEGEQGFGLRRYCGLVCKTKAERDREKAKSETPIYMHQFK